MIPNISSYFVIKSLTQIPEIDITISPLPWKPCAVEVIKQYTADTISHDPYYIALRDIFLFQKIICSNEICKNTAYCHPLYFALSISNWLKYSPEQIYINEYIHPIPPYTTARHRNQHFLKNFGNL